MIRRAWRAICFLALGLGCPLEGCSGTETGNPKPIAIELRFTAYSDDFSQVSVGLQGGALRVDHAFVMLDSVQLLPCSGSGKPLELSVGALELTERPSRVLVAESQDVDFCAARVLLTRGPADIAPELAGRSAVVEGVRADGVPFQIASELELTVELTSGPPASPFQSRLLLGFNLAKWLSGVDVETAAADNGMVTIDSTHGVDALAVFDAQLKSTVALFDDADGNGQLAGDNQPPAASAEP